MYIIDVPDGSGTGPNFAAAAEAVAMVKRKPPLVQVSVNGDEAILEAVELLRSTRTQMELLTNTINERFNVTFIGVGDKITSIVGNIDTITNNIAHSSSNLNQPVLFMLFMCVILLIFIMILLFCILKTRREFRKRKTIRSPSISPATQPAKTKASSVRNSGVVKQLKRHIPSGWRPLHRDRYRKGQLQHERSASDDSIDVEKRNESRQNDDEYKEAAAPPTSSSALEYSKAPTLKASKAKKISVDTSV